MHLAVNLGDLVCGREFLKSRNRRLNCVDNGVDLEQLGFQRVWIFKRVPKIFRFFRFLFATLLISGDPEVQREKKLNRKYLNFRFCLKSFSIN